MSEEKKNQKPASSKRAEKEISLEEQLKQISGLSVPEPKEQSLEDEIEQALMNFKLSEEKVKDPLQSLKNTGKPDGNTRIIEPLSGQKKKTTVPDQTVVVPEIKTSRATDSKAAGVKSPETKATAAGKTPEPKASEKPAEAKAPQAKAPEKPGAAKAAQAKTPEKPGAAKAAQAKTPEKPEAAKAAQAKTPEKPGAAKAARAKASEKPGAGKAAQAKAPEKMTAENKKSGKGKRIAGIVAAAAAVVLLGAYAAGAVYYNSHFYSNTTINQMECSGQTVEQVAHTLTEEVNRYELVLQEREDITETISGKDIDLQLQFDGSFEELLHKQNPFLWFTGWFKKSNYSVGSSLTYDEDKLKTVISSLKACNPVLMLEPVDASVEWDISKKYVVNPGVKGTKLDEPVFLAAVKESVGQLERTLNLEEKNCYLPQKISADDPRMATAVDELNKYCQSVITYQFQDQTEVCDGEIIRQWLSLDENYAVQISTDKVREYIDTLGDKYNTYGSARNFVTHAGGTVQVTKGDYGWRMNRADTTDELIAAVREGGSHTKEFLWLQTANAAGAKDWGNTYVEMDLSKQHLWFYKDGQVIIEADFVSGKVSAGHGTPVGIYSLKYKEKDRILRGQIQANGRPEYESHVNFWMPFNGGVGMHDASWRSSYGGNIYYYSGSHGCINLPYSKAKAIYENITAGTPVVVYYSTGGPSAPASAPATTVETPQEAPQETPQEAPQEVPQPPAVETPAEPTPAPPQPPETEPAPAPAPEETGSGVDEQSSIPQE